MAAVNPVLAARFRIPDVSGNARAGKSKKYATCQMAAVRQQKSSKPHDLGDMTDFGLRNLANLVDKKHFLIFSTIMGLPYAVFLLFLLYYSMNIK